MPRLLALVLLLASSLPARADTAGARAPVVLFSRYGDGLVPVACFDGHTLRPGAACLRLVPAGASVRFANGKEARVRGRAKLPIVDDTVEGLRVAGGADKDGGDWAVWPATATPVLPLPEPPLGIRLDGDARAQLERLAGGPVTRVHALLARDLDGDGAPERVFAYDGASEGGAAVLGAHDRVQLVAPGASQWRVLALTDLDGDGRPEVYLRSDMGEVLFRVNRAGTVEKVAEWAWGD